MDSRELCLLPVARLGKLIRTRELSPVEVVRAYLERVQALEPSLNSYITVLADQALASARDAEMEIGRGNYVGPMHGIPVALKDLFATRGVRTTSGSTIFRDHVPDHDSTVVERFRQAGAIIIGKLNLHEFAYGPTGENPHYGPSRNPWDTGRITGGSSGGSGAAVAAGECAAAMGTDTGGSVRIPASLCGIVGLKPTYGLVSRYGITPLSWSLDHAGPMTRTVEDCAITLQAIAGHDPKDPASARARVPDYSATLERGIRRWRVGVPRELFWDHVDPEVESLVRQAIATLEGLGARVEEVSAPLLPYSYEISTAVLAAEAVAVHGELLRTRGAEYDPVVRTRLETGLFISATDYLRAQRARAMLTAQLSSVLERVDLLAAPATPITATPLGTAHVKVGGETVEVRAALTRCTRPFNLAGLPAITVPCGFTSAGLPAGLQLVARPFAEARLLRAAHAYQQATVWHERHPG